MYSVPDTTEIVSVPDKNLVSKIHTHTCARALLKCQSINIYEYVA